MTRKIFRSILLVAGVVLLASTVLFLGFLYGHFGSLQEEQLRDGLSLAACGVENGGQSYLDALSPSGYRLTWVSADGTVLHDTAADAGNMESHAGREEIQTALATGTGGSVRYSDTMLERTLYCATRLADGTVLRISVSHATVWALVFSMMQPLCLVLLVALVLSAVLAGRVSRRIVEPLNHLDLEQPLENEAYEEIAPVLGRIDRQQRQIRAQLADLKRSRSEFEQIIGSMTEGLVLLNEKGVILSINPAARSLFHAEQSCVQQHFLQLERAPAISQAVHTALAGQHRSLRFERDGMEIQLSVSPITQEGATIGAVILTWDVTQQAFAERNRREFTANVSHELKTPLQSICASAELMENGLVKPENMPRFVGHIRRESTRLMTLIGDIIRLSELDEGEPLPCEEVRLRVIADEVAASLSDLAAAKHVSFSVSGDAASIQSVHRLWVEALYNLCDNAIRYNTEGGSVEMIVEDASVTVKDTGIGIPAEHQERVFERFYRVDKSHSKESGGTGLGLSIVKHAVQALGGTITLQSMPGKGTSIRIACTGCEASAQVDEKETGQSIIGDHGNQVVDGGDQRA